MSTASGPSEIVHLEYKDFESVPPKPGSNYTRFVCISDTHAHTFEVPGSSEDILLHSGDLTNSGAFAEVKTTVDWLTSLPHRLKIIIAGNHDLTLDDQWYNEDQFFGAHREPVEKIKEMLSGPEARQAGLIYLQDEQFSFEDGSKTWTVYGSPWSPWFLDWAFNYDRAKTGPDLVAKFPRADILLTHGPPADIFDRTISGEEVGCVDLRERLLDLKPRLSLFGHIHEDHGAAIHSWSDHDEQWPTYHSPGMDFVDGILRTPETVTLSSQDNGENHTVFVNASAWPAGPASALSARPIFGGPGFRPVIVDLKH